MNAETNRQTDRQTDILWLKQLFKNPNSMTQVMNRCVVLHYYGSRARR